MNLITLIVLVAYLGAGVWMAGWLGRTYGLSAWVAFSVGLLSSVVMFGMTSLLLRVLMPEPRQHERRDHAD